MKFGYARVSTKKPEQDASLKAQIEQLKEAGCDEVCYDRASGILDNRTEFAFMISKLRKGDTVCVTRLDRLGRRMISLINLINDFNEKGITFQCLDQSIDTSTPMGQLIFNLFASFAEMEHQLNSERVKLSMERAKKEGRWQGKPRILTDKQVVKMKEMRDNLKIPIKEICRLHNMSRSCYYSYYNNT